MNRILLNALTALLMCAALLPRSAPATVGSARVKSIGAEFIKRFDRPRVALDPIIVTSTERDGLLREKLTVSSESGVRVPVLILRRADAVGRLPAVVCLHGLGGSKEGMSSYLEEFARRGFVGVALDARYHGDRSGDLSHVMIESFKTGKEHPYLWDTVWDTWRVLDYLQTRKDVDRNRLGVMGISLGGHTTWMVSADPRVKVAAPCISVCSWRWQLDHQGYTQRVSNLKGAFDGVRQAMGAAEIDRGVVAAAWEKWMPGVPREFDCQDILAAMAPRPLLIIGGDSDPVAPLEGAQLAFDTIVPAYKRAKATDRLKIMIAPKSGHTVTKEQELALFDWFERWLKPSAK